MGKDIIKEFLDATPENFGAIFVGGFEQCPICGMRPEKMKQLAKAIKNIKQELLSEIEGKLPKEKTQKDWDMKNDPDNWSGFIEVKFLGFNSCLKQIRSIINLLK